MTRKQRLSNLKQNDWKVIDENGELVDKVSEGEYIVHAKEDDGLDHDVGKEHYTKLKQEAVLKMWETLSYVDVATANRLSILVDYNNCILCHQDKKNKGQYFDIKGLADELGMEIDTMRKIINSLIEETVLARTVITSKEDPKSKIKYDVLVMNPHLFTMGKTIPREYVALFEDSKFNPKNIQPIEDKKELEFVGRFKYKYINDKKKSKQEEEKRKRKANKSE